MQRKLSDILTDETKWTTRVYARDADGEEIQLQSLPSEFAACYCISGAAAAAADGFGDSNAFDFEHVVIKPRLIEAINGAGFDMDYGDRQVIHWNDDPARTFDDIRKVCAEYDRLFPPMS